MRTYQLPKILRYLQKRSQFLADAVPLSRAFGIGIVTGFVAVALITAIQWLRAFLTSVEFEFGIEGVLIIMMLAGLVVGWIIHRYSPEVQSSGISEVIEAVAIRRAIIRPSVAFYKFVASALTIGLGGSAGYEGPIVQIGSTLASAEGQLLRLTDDRVKVLVASGAAAGIAAAFNAPIAGSLFALEVILGHFNNRYLAMIVTAAVSSNIVSRLLLSDELFLQVPAHTLNSIWELPLYLLLGIASGIVAVVFIRVLYATEDLFKKFIKFMPYRASIGMGLTGFVFIIYPSGLALNAAFTEDAISFNSDLTIITMLILFGVKMLTTSLTLGAGNSGGLFAPVLFMGAMLGGVFGHAGNFFFPETIGDTGAFAVVGMAALLSASVHAPISSIIIIVEMSGNYQLIVPLLIAVDISTLVADVLQPDSIYVRKLTRRGIQLNRGQDIDLLQAVTVDEVMDSDYEAVLPDMQFQQLVRRFEETHHHGFPVINAEHKLVGIVTLSDLERGKREGCLAHTPVIAFATIENLMTVYPDDPVYNALRYMNMYHVGRLPVISRQTHEFIGMIRRDGILHAYEIALLRKSRERHRLEHFKLRNFERDTFIELEVAKDAPMDGKVVMEFPYSGECLLVSVRREGETMIARGKTRILAGDIVTAYASLNVQNDVHAQFSKPAPVEEV